MAIAVSDNFSYQGRQPNFARDSFNTLAEMKAFDGNCLDNGHRSFCAETKKYYEYLDSNSVDTTTGRWRLITDTALNESSENPVQNKVINARFNQLALSASQGMAAINLQIQEMERELKAAISETEQINSSAFGYLEERILTLHKILGQALADLNAVMVTGDTLVNGHLLSDGNIELTKADVGLDRVNNTSDSEKPISTATQNALNSKVDKVNGYSLVSNNDITRLQSLPDGAALNGNIQEIRNELSSHIGNVENPHQVTMEQLGVDTELDKKVDKTTKINGHTLDSDITIVPGDLGLNKVNNTTDLEKPISTATQNALNGKVDNTTIENVENIVLQGKVSEELGKKVDKETGKTLIESNKITAYDAHIISTSNPHGVKKDQVGLGNVDNTADIDKPISNPVREALEESEFVTTKAFGKLEDSLKESEELIGAALNEINKTILPYWIGTQAEYAELAEIDDNTLYIIL